MFPRLRNRLAPALLQRLDVLVELSTLGEYGIDESGRPMPLPFETPPAPAGAARLAPRRRDRCAPLAEVSPRRCASPTRS